MYRWRPKHHFTNSLPAINIFVLRRLDKFWMYVPVRITFAFWNKSNQTKWHINLDIGQTSEKMFRPPLNVIVCLLVKHFIFFCFASQANYNLWMEMYSIIICIATYTLKWNQHFRCSWLILFSIRYNLVRDVQSVLPSCTSQALVGSSPE